MSSTKRIQMAPLRTLSDFLLDSKKYNPPVLNDLKRFNNRVTSNLLYYQTNYFAVSAVVFLLFLLFGFQKMFFGAAGIAVTGAFVLYSLDKVPKLAPLRAKYPVSMIGLGIIDLMIVYSSFRCILFFVLALLVPLLLWIVHASTRSRGIKNKINNKVDQLTNGLYSSSPMGYAFSIIGFEAKDYDE